MSFGSRRIAWLAGPVALLGLIAGAAVAVSLVGGDAEEVPPGDNAAALSATATVDPNDITPPPMESPYPTPNIFPSYTARPAPSAPASVIISGVVIPIPEGARYFYGQIPSDPPAPSAHWIYVGASSLRFGDYGLEFADIKPENDGSITATLDALWELTQKTALPSPTFVSVKSHEIPLPPGSFYTTETGPEDLGEPIVYIVRFHRSMFALDGRGLFNVSIRPEDATPFEPTINAASALSAD